VTKRKQVNKILGALSIAFIAIENMVLRSGVVVHGYKSQHSED
jgi:hypothetical protein